MIKKSCLFTAALLVSISLFADVRLPRLFGDNMVLQRDKPIAVWGWASAGEKVTVHFNNLVKTAKADKQGRWSLQLDPMAAGGPYQMVITGSKGTASSTTFNNVMVGEVWICSGQSNMEMPIAGWGKINNYQQEIAAANYDAIRHIKIPNTVALVPQNDIPSGQWQVCSPQTAGEFSAVAYFFARELYQKLHIPIGLINTSWGGTMVETWTSRGAFEQSDEFKEMIGTMTSATDIKKMGEQKKDELTKKIVALQGSMTGDETHYAAADLDDSHWRHMKLPGQWEQAGMGLEELDGVVWFRKAIDLSASEAGEAAVLDIGKVDDADETYVNGVKVGATPDYITHRQYKIPAGVLKAGKNVIAVRAQDNGGNGGIYGDPGELKCTIGVREIPLAGDWSFRVASIIMNTAMGPNSAPTLLFNAMLYPLIPYTIRGAIWYQGETNAGRAYQYRKAFPLMINDWRQRWKEGDFPFYFVQLSSWVANNGNSLRGSNWAELREAQAMTLSLPNTGMAVTTDIGNSIDIHPKDKQDVGKRLAFIALNNLYGQTMEYSGPVYQSMETDGHKVILHFTHTGRGLSTPDKYGYLRGFEVAGADHIWHYAKAIIEGNTVVVWQDAVAAPVAVRYGWMDDALEVNLFNKDGLPASPFRTDQWKAATEEVKYAVGK